MGQKITCTCGKRFFVKSSYQASSVKCPECGARLAVAGESELTINIPGIHSDGTERRSRRQRQPWIVPVACTLLGVVLTAIVWPILTNWLSSDGPPQRIEIGAAPEAGNPFARVQSSTPQVTRPSRSNSNSSSKSDDGDRLDDDPRLTAGSRKDSAQTNQVVVVGSGPMTAGQTQIKSTTNSAEDEEDKGAAVGVAQLADLIEDVERCVVRLDFVSASGQGCGSGFVVDKDGTIVTNYHVVEEATSMTATFNNSSKLPIAGFKFVVPEKDLAVLQTAPPNGPLTTLRVAKKFPRKGESVVAFGSPLGLSFSASEGIVSAIRTAQELADLGVEVAAGTWIQMTTQISPGNSGGPLVTQRGEVVGVNTMTLTAGQNLNFAISCDDVRMALDKARGKAVTAISPERLPPASGRRRAARPATGGEVEASEDVHLAKTDLSPGEASRFDILAKSVWFGFKWVDVIDFDVRATRGLPTRSGVVVTEVAYHSPAYRAGIKKGDVIRTINGQAASQSSVVEELIDEFTPGKAVAVSILRPETPGRYSKKDVTVRVEALVSGRMLAHVSSEAIPIEVRDFLKRHLLRYFTALADTIGSAEQEKSPLGRLRAMHTSGSSSANKLTVKDIRNKSPFDPLFLPSFGAEVPVHVGNIGNLHRVHVMVVVTRKMVVCRINHGLVALLADTSNLVDGEYMNLGNAQIIGTVTLGAFRGGLGKIFVARPFEAEKYFPKWEAPREEAD